MSKERLEEIKMLWEQNNDVCFPDDYEWLIEQAEQVQELEKENEKLRKLEKYDSLEINNLSQQNNRYREALEFYALGRHWITSLKDGRDYVNEYGERARKALECEE